MGYSTWGFDIYPPLDPTLSTGQDTTSYLKFREEILEKWDDITRNGQENRVLGDPTARQRMTIGFLVAGSLTIPSDPNYCKYFLRFAPDPRVHDDVADTAEAIVNAVCAIAKTHFGDRVIYWNDVVEGQEKRYAESEIRNAERECIALWNTPEEKAKHGLGPTPGS